MATEFTLQRPDGAPLGTFNEVQTMIRRHFPSVQFSWTTSGLEKLKLAKERGLELPPEIRKACESLPSLLEGSAGGTSYQIAFGLGHEEPVCCLYVEPRGDHQELLSGLAAMEKEVGAAFRISGSN
ncbi:MAG TPA: hypothetical protein VGI40_28670 [Pirellulaceae bacterium]|jgi:hypothetical protein